MKEEIGQLCRTVGKKGIHTRFWWWTQRRERERESTWKTCEKDTRFEI